MAARVDSVSSTNHWPARSSAAGNGVWRSDFSRSPAYQARSASIMATVMGSNPLTTRASRSMCPATSPSARDFSRTAPTASKSSIRVLVEATGVGSSTLLGLVTPMDGRLRSVGWVVSHAASNNANIAGPQNGVRTKRSKQLKTFMTRV